MPSNASLAEEARSDVTLAHATPPSSLLREVLEGLRAGQPTLPAKLFYDEVGSRIYDEITALEEYYPNASLSFRARPLATSPRRMPSRCSPEFASWSAAADTCQWAWISRRTAQLSS